MTWLWILLGVIFSFFILFRLVVWLSSNWRMTLNSVITQFIAITMRYPEYDFEYWKKHLLETRYPSGSRGFLEPLYKSRLAFEEIMNDSTVHSQTDDLVYSFLIENTLPSIILSCLMIEGHKVVKSNKSIENLYPSFIAEVKRQGFSKYC